jgi:hypothetical protein
MGDQPYQCWIENQRLTNFPLLFIKVDFIMDLDDVDGGNNWGVDF